MISAKKSSLNCDGIGTLVGAIAGLFIGIVVESFMGMSVLLKSFFPVITGLALFGAILGAILGSGINRLRNDASVANSQSEIEPGIPIHARNNN
jgi:hypothetical protein